MTDMRLRGLLTFFLILGSVTVNAQSFCEIDILQDSRPASTGTSAPSVRLGALTFENEQEANIRPGTNTSQVNLVNLLYEKFRQSAVSGGAYLAPAAQSPIYRTMRLTQRSGPSVQVGFYRELTRHYRPKGLGRDAQELEVRYKETYGVRGNQVQSGLASNDTLSTLPDRIALTFKQVVGQNGYFQQRAKTDLELFANSRPPRDLLTQFADRIVDDLGYSRTGPFDLQYLATTSSDRVSLDLIYNDQKIGFVAVDKVKDMDNPSIPDFLQIEIELSIGSLPQEAAAQAFVSRLIDVVEGEPVTESKLQQVLIRRFQRPD